MTLSEQYAQALDNLLCILRAVKASGQMIDGVPSESLFNFARSEISGLAQGFNRKDECKDCADCCILPQAIVPLQGIDSGVIRPLQYGLKHRRQPCWWLRMEDGAFKCCLHVTNEKPYTCLAYLCKSRQELTELITNAEKQEEAKVGIAFQKQQYPNGGRHIQTIEKMETEEKFKSELENIRKNRRRE